MLVLTRRPGESLLIGPDVTLTVLDIDGDRIKLGISAPSSVTILRQELADEAREGNPPVLSSRSLDPKVLHSAGKLKLKLSPLVTR